MKLMARLRQEMLAWLWRVWAGSADSVGACANRAWAKRTVGALEFSFIVRRTDVPDGYSREEIAWMLKAVREHERRVGWTAPEPT